MISILIFSLAPAVSAESPSPLEAFLTFPTRNQLVSWEDEEGSKLAWVDTTAGIANVFGVRCVEECSRFGSLSVRICQS